MKKFILVLLSMYSLSSAASAGTDKTQVYTFKYKMPGETFEYRKPASSYKDAFEEAAQACFNHYKAISGKLSREAGLDIIDVCANPKI